MSKFVSNIITHRASFREYYYFFFKFLLHVYLRAVGALPVVWLLHKLIKFLAISLHVLDDLFRTDIWRHWRLFGFSLATRSDEDWHKTR